MNTSTNYLNLPEISVTHLIHREQKVLLLRFGYDTTLQAIAKKLGATFTKTHKGWQ